MATSIRNSAAGRGTGIRPIVVILAIALLLGATVGALGTTIVVVAFVCVGATVVLAAPTLAYFVLLLLLPIDLHVQTNTIVDAVFDPLRILVSSMVLLRRFAADGSALPRNGIALFAGLYVASVFASVVAADLNPHLGLPLDSIRASYKLAGYVVFAAAGAVILRNETGLKMLYIALVAGALASVAYELYQLYVDGFGSIYLIEYPLNADRLWAGRPSGLLNYANSCAAYLNLILGLTVAMTLHGPSPSWRRSSLAATLALGIGLLLTQSRGGWIAAAAILFLALFVRAPGFLRIPIASLLVVVGAITAAEVPFIADRLLHVDYQITASRFALWNAALALFEQSPLIGVGYGSYEVRYPAVLVLDFWFGTETIQSHNLYLQVLSETGVAGFAAFFAMVGLSARQAASQFRLYIQSRPLVGALMLGIAYAILSTLVHGVVDVFFIASPQFAAAFWLMVGVLAGWSRRTTSPE